MTNRKWSSDGRNDAGGAAGEPVTLTALKTHLRIDHNDDDDYLLALIRNAVDYTERICERALIPRTVHLYIDQFPVADTTAVELPMPPAVSITSIKYFDDQDVEQTWSSANYQLDTLGTGRALVYPARYKSWPVARDWPNSVHFEYIAGYSDSAASPQDIADNVPDEIKHAIKMLAGHWYENRETSIVGVSIENIPDAYDALISNFRMY